MKTAFINATLYLLNGEILENGILVIENGKIDKVGSDINIDNMNVIDCKNQHITPGFLDAHTHTGIWEEGAGPGPGNNDGNELSDVITPYVRALDSIYPEDIGFEDARKSGVTTLGITHGSANPIGGQLCIVKSYGSEADDMVIKQPAAIKMALGENPKRVGDLRNRAPTSRMGVAYQVRKAFYEAMDYKKEWQYYQDMMKLEEEKPASERKPIKTPKFDIGLDILVKVLNREIPIRCHSHRVDDIRTAIRLSEEFGYKLIIDHATEGYKIRETLAKKNIPVNVGPMIGGRTKRETMKMTQANPGLLVKAGVHVSIMTDSPFTPVYHLRDSMIFAIREGLPQEKALDTITINPAKTFELEDRLGSLTAGKDADFVIFDGSPFDARSKVLKTYIDGNLVFEYEEPK